MATQYTFARLTAPSQFMPEDEVIFKLEYSEDLVSTEATLVVDGYTDYWPGSEQVPAYNYGNYQQSKYIHTSMGSTWDVGYEEFIVPANSLGIIPPPEQPIGYWTGKAKARVEFRGRSGDSEIRFVSNSVPVNIIFMWESNLRFCDTPYYVSSSVFYPKLEYITHTTVGEYDSLNINSYRFFLYDDQYNQIDDSGELYDWNSYIYYQHSSFSFKGLKDDHTYYVRAKVTLNGGYVFWRGYESVYVNYSNLPSADERVHLSNAHSGVGISVDLTGLTHDRTVITRSIVGEDIWLEVKDTPNPNSFITVTDHYAVTGKRYMYRVVVYSENSVVETYYNYINYSNNNIVISDAYGSYVAVGSIEKYPISRNDRGQEHVTMDSKYPYYTINGQADYDSGSLNALFAEVDDDCSVKLDNQEYSEMLRAWLNNGQAKLLTYYTGESWIVAVSGIQTTDPEHTDTLNTSFNWVQIGDADNIEAYPTYGLAVSDNV